MFFNHDNHHDFFLTADDLPLFNDPYPPAAYDYPFTQSLSCFDLEGDTQSQLEQLWGAELGHN